MRIHFRLAVTAALCLAASAAQADNGKGFGRCKAGFADDTVVHTEARGNLTIGEVRPSDRVWSFNEIIGEEGWSRVLQRVDSPKHYKLLSEFTAPGSAVATRACWIIRRTS